MKLLIDNSQRIFIITTSLGSNYTCNLSQINSIIVKEGLTEGYFKIYELLNSKLKYVSKERLRTLYAANQVDVNNTIVSIDVHTKGYRDVSVGNNYIAGTVTVNYGLSSVREFILPFQYGSKDLALQIAEKILSENGILPTFENSYDSTDYIRHNGIVINTSHADGYKKYELKMIG